MKLLLDQNISFRVIKLLSGTFDSIRQIRQLNLVDASDREIWNFALKDDYTIITFDADFIDISNLRGFPPKIIWLRFGNSSNLKIANKLISKEAEIREFVSNSEVGFLEID